MRITVEFEWAVLGPVHAPSGRLVMPDVPAEPGVYRFMIRSNDGVDAYIGESQDLRHRMLRNYANTHRGRTNVRVRAVLLARIADGSFVELAKASNVGLESAGTRSLADLTLKHIRVLVENAAIEAARQDGVRIFNA